METFLTLKYTTQRANVFQTFIALKVIIIEGTEDNYTGCQSVGELHISCKFSTLRILVHHCCHQYISMSR